MNTILKKDLRENFKLALIGLVIFSLILVAAFDDSLRTLNNLLLYVNNGTVSALNPLIWENTISLTMLFCAIYGALLGWLQTRNEAHRDLWAFLIHRPITRAQIFQGKILAGLLLYAAGAGIPLLLLMIVCITPGHVPVPFEWPMLLPLTAAFLTGITYYFAGVLTGLRQARWYGSRCFGLGVALLTSVFMFKSVEFWSSFVATFFFTSVLAAAACGAYQSGGFYRGQPPLGKSALALSMAGGAGVILIVVISLTMWLLLDRVFENTEPFSRYTMLMSGQVVKETWLADELISVEDLAGKPWLDPKTGHPPDRNDLDRQRASGDSVDAHQRWEGVADNSYQKGYHFYSLWNVADKKLWYVDRHGRLLGFDGITKRFIGELRPSDASGGLDAASFMRPKGIYGPDYFYQNPSLPPSETLVTSNAVYRIDVRASTVTRIFAVAPGDTLVGYSKKQESQHILFATEKTVQLLETNGAVIFQTAYSPSLDLYPGVQLFTDSQDQPLALWFNPEYYKSPEHVAWVNPDGQVSRSADIPSLDQDYSTPFYYRLATSLTPPVPMVVDHLYSFHSFKQAYQVYHLFSGFEFLVSCGWSVACVLIGLGMMSRYHFSGVAKAWWSVFILALGIPGLIGLLVTEEWPVREVCPKCRRLRAVDREHCEYCAAEFPAPEKNGTEIFEPIGEVLK